jgi:uncharacterized protein GlcG (DUF336 family)
MLAILIRLAMLGGLSAVAPLAHAQLLTHRDLSYAISKTIAEIAIDSCAAKGYGVSAVVVDRDGEVIIALRGDNAGPHTMENARRKAYTARSFRTSTAAYAKRFADNDPVVRQQVTLPSVIAIPGGLPERARSKPPLQSKMRRRLLRTKIPPRPRFRHPSLMRLLHGDQALECSKSASSLIRSVPEQQQKDNDRNGYAE